MSFSPDFLFAAGTLGVTFFVIWCLWSLMWGNVPFSAKARQKKEQKVVLGAAQTFILSYEDLPAYRDGGEFAARMGELRAAVASKDVAETRKSATCCIRRARSAAFALASRPSRTRARSAASSATPILLKNASSSAAGTERLAERIFQA